MRIFDINCDIGGNLGDNGAIIKFINSSNMAGGGNACDSYSIKKSILLSRANEVRERTHPGYYKNNRAVEIRG